jgi:antitoxin (DNA-binding transcriptional repressor) of toxin-antitoxin stability system
VTTTAEVGEVAGRIAELIDQVKAGNEVVLSEGHKPVARLVAPVEEPSNPAGQILNIRAVEGHKVLVPTFSHAELAEEMFGER